MAQLPGGHRIACTFAAETQQRNHRAGDDEVSDEFNMSMRKFLKRVGVTSQRAIEDAIRNAGVEKAAGRSFEIKAELTCDELDLKHVVVGTVTSRGE